MRTFGKFYFHLSRHFLTWNRKSANASFWHFWFL